MQTEIAGSEEDAPFKDEEIRDELERILSSNEFHLPERGRRFLEFVVAETLAGRSECLKAYTIAQEVFARDPSFDAQNDPVVRIEAGRIRRALERYYLVAGRSDAIVVTIPKGGYVPFFSRRAEGATAPSSEVDQHPSLAATERITTRSWYKYAIPVALAAMGILSVILLSQSASPVPSSAGEQPNIVVEQFLDISGKRASSDVAQGMMDEVISELARFKEIVVLASADFERAKKRPTTRLFALQGSVRAEGEKLRTIVRLVRSADGAVVWSDTYDTDIRSDDPLAIQADIAQRIATAVAPPYGSIYQNGAPELHGLSGGDWDSYACMRSYYNYRADLNPQNHAAVKDCLKEATQNFPANSSLWALLSQTYLDEIRFQYLLVAPSSPNALALADDAAQKAADLDPQNARALQAMMLVHFFKGDVAGALKAGAEAYELNPNDTEVAGEYGFRLAMSGRWDTGCELISRAINRNPGPKEYYEVGMALCAYMRGDNQAAELWGRMANLKYNPMHHLVLLAILGAAGKLDEAANEQKWLQANAPRLVDNIRAQVALRLSRPEDQARFLSGLRAAGMNVDGG